MVNIGNILSGAGSAAGTAKDEMTKTSRRKFMSATGAALLGLGVDEVANDGDIREGAIETGGNWWEEIIEDPVGMEIDTVTEYNEAVDEFASNFEDQYRSDLHEARGTENVGRVPGHLSAGDTLDDEQYAALGFNSEDTSTAEGNALETFTLGDDDFTVLTSDAVSMGDSEAFGEDFGAIGINTEDNEFDASDLVEMRNAYRRAAQTTQDWLVRADQLQTEGQSLDRLSVEYEDEEEIPAVEQAQDNTQYLGDVKNTLTSEHLRFRAQANLFDHALQKTPYDDGEEVGTGYGDEPTTEEPGNGNGTTTETPGEHGQYGDISEYCDFTDQQINDLNEYMDDNNIDSYDEFDVDISSTNGDFTVELTYDGETIDFDSVEGCGA